METAKHKAICPMCKGNGFKYIANSSWKKVVQCETCNSQGEINVEEPTFEELEKAKRLQ